MIKFSIITPIYNVEDYLPKCLDSVMNQTFGDFECLLMCDDSTDNSSKVALEYAKKDKRFKIFNNSNTGLSIARNLGVKEAKGEYLLFLDSDDYFDINLLDILNKEITREDLVRFQIREVFSDHYNDWNEKGFSDNGINAFNKIVAFHYVEPAWAYAYNRDFYLKNEFKFMDNCIAEDFGIVPLIIAMAEKVKVLSFIGYNYVQRNNSLMNNDNYDKKIKKMEDMIKQGEFLHNKFKEIDNKDVFMRFINNSLIGYVTSLKYKDYKKYIKILKKMKIFDYIHCYSFMSRVRKIFIRGNAYLYYKWMVR